MAKQIISVLAGGLGNQLFQYCFALSLSKKLQVPLSLDVHSGFLRDPFKRNFELQRIAPECSKAPWMSSLISILLFKLRSFFEFFSINTSSYVPGYHELKIFYLGRYALLSESTPLPKLKSLPLNFDFLRISGYWQSPSLFQESQQEILDLFSSFVPESTYIQDLGRQLRDSETIALGVRVYEETATPELNAFNGQVKPIMALNPVISQILQGRPHCQVALFCSHRSPLLAQLSLPPDTIFLTGDDLVPSAQDTLWLMSQCRHHVFLNSSLYWWGAFFSQLNHSMEEQLIFAANNFVNQACYLNGWRKF